MACATASLGLFLLRGAWALWRPGLLERRWVKLLPHVVDTAFLASGLLLAALLRQYPFVHAWLTAKVLGLIVYIVLGSVALKRAKTRRGRVASIVAATCVFIYIVGVALAHDPRSWSGLVGWLEPASGFGAGSALQ